MALIGLGSTTPQEIFWRKWTNPFQILPEMGVFQSSFVLAFASCLTINAMEVEILSLLLCVLVEQYSILSLSLSLSLCLCFIYGSVGDVLKKRRLFISV